MTRSKQILALLTTTLAVAVVAPAASAADGTDGVRWHAGEPAAKRFHGVEPDRRHFRSVAPSAYKIRSVRIRYGSVSPELRLRPAGYRYR